MALSTISAGGAGIHQVSLDGCRLFGSLLHVAQPCSSDSLELFSSEGVLGEGSAAVCGGVVVDFLGGTSNLPPEGLVEAFCWDVLFIGGKAWCFLVETGGSYNF